MVHEFCYSLTFSGQCSISLPPENVRKRQKTFSRGKEMEQSLKKG